MRSRFFFFCFKVLLRINIDNINFSNCLLIIYLVFNQFFSKSPSNKKAETPKKSPVKKKQSPKKKLESPDKKVTIKRPPPSDEAEENVPPSDGNIAAPPPPVKRARKVLEFPCDLCDKVSAFYL